MKLMKEISQGVGGYARSMPAIGWSVEGEVAKRVHKPILLLPLH
jgi:hypothetical protein